VYDVEEALDATLVGGGGEGGPLTTDSRQLAV
jgi:hypothetical protein